MKCGEGRQGKFHCAPTLQWLNRIATISFKNKHQLGFRVTGGWLNAKTETDVPNKTSFSFLTGQFPLCIFHVRQGRVGGRPDNKQPFQPKTFSSRRSSWKKRSLQSFCPSKSVQHLSIVFSLALLYISPPPSHPFLSLPKAKNSNQRESDRLHLHPRTRDEKSWYHQDPTQLLSTVRWQRLIDLGWFPQIKQGWTCWLVD